MVMVMEKKVGRHVPYILALLSDFLCIASPSLGGGGVALCISSEEETSG